MLGGLGGVGDEVEENAGISLQRGMRDQGMRLGRTEQCPHPVCLPSPVQAMGIKTALPTAELGLYSLVLSGALAYAGRGLLEASQGNSWAPGQQGGTLLLLGASGFQPARPDT